MKKIVLLAFVFLLLSTALVGVQVVKADIIGNNGMRYATLPYIIFPSKFLTLNVSVTFWDAPPDAITEPTTIIIVSPEENRTYATNSVTLKVNVGMQPVYSHYIRSVYYRADWLEKGEQIFYHLAFYDGKAYLAATKISITLKLAGIPDGNHNITVYASDSYGIVTPSTVNFTIDTHLQEDTTPPTISIASPENKTYTVNNVSLTFTVNELTSSLGYSLDGQVDVPISGTPTFIPSNPIGTVGNTTLTGLSEGLHNITVYAIDTSGNGASETIYFSIRTQLPRIPPEPFPRALIAAATVIVAIAVVGAALLVYFVKVKKTTGA